MTPEDKRKFVEGVKDRREASFERLRKHLKAAAERAIEVAKKRGAKIHPRVKQIKSDTGSVT